MHESGFVNLQAVLFYFASTL